MKKILFIASILLLGAVACTKELKEVENPTPDNKGMVAVTMQLQVPVSLQASTKANKRDIFPHIDDIRVAVFGTSGYLQAYALAEPVNDDGSPATAYATTNDVDPRDDQDIYYFRVLLPVYEGEAHVHIIANGDESLQFSDQTEYSIMSAMASTENVGAYWTRVVLENGILAQTNEDGVMVVDDAGNLKPNAETARLFNKLVLVRNFAEISLNVADGAGIDVVSWALVNDPKSGSVAPMDGTEFIDNYKDYVYDAQTGKMVLCDVVTDPATGKLVPSRDADGKIINLQHTYKGYMVSNALNTLPAQETDLDWKEPGDHVFTYERVDPNKTNPTYIMLKCKFGSDSDFSYYRVDLMDENIGGYFPIYRNFYYQIDIGVVGNKGASTFTEAANRNSGGNVSMSAETKTLTDVSDGFSRMYVEFVEKTYTTGGQKSFWVYYVPDVTKDADDDDYADVDNRSIVVSVKDMGTALASATITKDATRSVDTGTGARWFFNFELNGQDDDEDLISVIEVKASNGKTGTARSTLYRDLSVKVMKKMDMTLSLEPDTLPEGVDKTTVLHIALADTLQPSMFPLEFYIEDENRTLNPTGKDGSGKSIEVPVKVGPSIWNSNDDNSYFFIRTVNWSEYEPMRDAWKAAKEAGTSTDGIIDFTTQFKTIEVSSATTIHVDNEYFNMQSIDLDCAPFAVSTTLSEVGYQAGSATVTVSTGDDVEWTATVNNGAGLTRAAGEVAITGKGSESFTFNFDQNSTDQTKVYTITVTADGFPAATTTINQRRAPAPVITGRPVSFPRNSFTGANASANSSDGYLTVKLNGLNTTESNQYLGIWNGRTITFTPNDGATIQKITIQFSDQNNTDTAPKFNNSSSGVSYDGAQVIWTGPATSAVTYTCGSGVDKNKKRKQIESISVEYN